MGTRGNARAPFLPSPPGASLSFGRRSKERPGVHGVSECGTRTSWLFLCVESEDTTCKQGQDDPLTRVPHPPPLVFFRGSEAGGERATTRLPRGSARAGERRKGA